MDDTTKNQRINYILEAMRKLHDGIRLLDDAQVGDYDNDISPIKHRIMEVVNRETNNLYAHIRKEMQRKQN